MNNESQVPTTALKAIRSYCLSCSGGKAKEVQCCELKECALYRFRFGKIPKVYQVTVKISDKKWPFDDND